MNRIYIIFLIASIILNISCSKQKQKKLELVKTIDFKTGFIQSNEATHYYDKTLKKDYVYITDKYSKKCIKRFFLDGRFIDSIPLNDVVEITKGYINNIRSIIPKTKDTTIITTTYSNQMITIKNNGEILSNLYVNKILSDTSNLKYQFVTNYGLNLIYNNKLLFRTDPGISYEYIIRSLHNKSDSHKLKFYDTELLKYPFFIEIDLPNTSTNEEFRYRFEKNNLLKKFEIYSGAGEFVDTRPIYIVYNDFIYLSTTTSDYIYKIRLSDFSITDKFKIKSSYGNIGVKPTIIDDTDEIKYSKQLDIWAKNRVINNIIDRIFYDENKEVFYVLVAMKINGFEELDNPGRNFSIIVFDKNFKQLGEYFFEREKYNYIKGIIMTSEGLMIFRKPENLTKENYGTQTFDLLKFN